MYKKSVLDNGLTVITETMPYTQAVSVSFFVRVGSRYETDKLAGISHFVEHMLFKGTTKRPTARQISEGIEGVGGVLNGGTDREATVYWFKAARLHFERALDVMADILLNSVFNPKEMDKERQVIIEEINMGFDDPAHRAAQLLDGILWPGHSLGRDIAGSKQSVKAITREDMLGFMAKYYLPGNTVVSVAGNISHDEVVAAISQRLGNWASGAPAGKAKPYVEKKGLTRLSLEKRDIEQDHLFLALPGLSYDHPRRFTLDLLNVILGEGMSSRLFSHIRDDMGLAYSIYSFADHLTDTGSLVVYAGVEPGNLEVAVAAIISQLEKLKDEVPAEELDKAKELSKGRLMLRMEDSRSVASWIGGQQVTSGHVLTLEQVLAIVDAISTEDLCQLAAEIIRPDKLYLSLVGPVADTKHVEQLLGI